MIFSQPNDFLGLPLRRSAAAGLYATGAPLVGAASRSLFAPDKRYCVHFGGML